jgi:hypothetical protein
MTLLHHSQLREHERPPSHARARTTTAKKEAPTTTRAEITKLE